MLADTATGRDENLSSSASSVLTCLLDILLQRVSARTLAFKDFNIEAFWDLLPLHELFGEGADLTTTVHIAEFMKVARRIRQLNWLMLNLSESVARIVSAKFVLEVWSTDPFGAGFASGGNKRAGTNILEAIARADCGHVHVGSATHMAQTLTALGQLHDSGHIARAENRSLARYWPSIRSAFGVAGSISLSFAGSRNGDTDRLLVCAQCIAPERCGWQASTP
eukprot:3713868-Amphidinium_carterae.1